MLIMFAKDVQLAVCVKDKKQGANIHRLSLITYTVHWEKMVPDGCIHCGLLE